MWRKRRHTGLELSLVSEIILIEILLLLLGGLQRLDLATCGTIELAWERIFCFEMDLSNLLCLDHPFCLCENRGNGLKMKRGSESEWLDYFDEKKRWRGVACMRPTARWQNLARWICGCFRLNCTSQLLYLMLMGISTSKNFPRDSPELNIWAEYSSCRTHMYAMCQTYVRYDISPLELANQISNISMVVQMYLTLGTGTSYSVLRTLCLDLTARDHQLSQ